MILAIVEVDLLAIFVKVSGMIMYTAMKQLLLHKWLNHIKTPQFWLLRVYVHSTNLFFNDQHRIYGVNVPYFLV